MSLVHLVVAHEAPTPAAVHTLSISPNSQMGFASDDLSLWLYFFIHPTLSFHSSINILRYRPPWDIYYTSDTFNWNTAKTYNVISWVAAVEPINTLLFNIYILTFSLLFLVVNAAHTFYNGTTTLPISEEDRTPRKRISKTLNMTTNPEEKRKIIGDTFVKVSRSFLTIPFKTFFFSLFLLVIKQLYWSYFVSFHR